MKYSNSSNSISIAAIPNPEYDLYSIQNEGKIVYVEGAPLIRLLSEIFRVPYEIHLVTHGQTGVKLTNGSWTGMTGMVQRSEVDLATGGVLTYERFQAINVSYPYGFSDITFMTDNPKPVPTSLAIFYPFSSILWIILIVAVLIFSCALHLHVHRTQTYQNIFCMLLGNLLEKSIDMRLRKLGLKLIVSMWLMFSFVITNSYKAVLLSILTLPPLIGIRDIADLAKAAGQDSVKCYTYKGASLTHILLQSDFDSWRSIGRCMQRNVIQGDDEEKSFVLDPSNKAFITRRGYLKPYEEMFLISKDSFYHTNIAFYLSKKFCCQEYLGFIVYLQQGCFRNFRKMRISCLN